MKKLILLVALLSFGCASAPPNLSVEGTTAYNNTRVIKGLDLIRDTAIDANKQIPPLISDATTRKIVMFHESALKTIDSIPSGWKNTVLTTLDEAIKDIPSSESKLIIPYVALAKTIISEVQ